MIFEDRLSARPNRYRVTDASGNVSYITLERADDPITPGTPLNAETFNNMQDEIQIASTDYPGCFYRIVDDETEWINPPMIPGVAYRTAERYNRSPVYVCVVETTLVGENPENVDGISLPFETYGRYRAIDVSGYVSFNGTDSSPLPYFDLPNGNTVYQGSEISKCIPIVDRGEGGLLIFYSPDNNGARCVVTVKAVLD